jgi:hypothetical protein
VIEPIPEDQPKPEKLTRKKKAKKELPEKGLFD